MRSILTIGILLSGCVLPGSKLASGDAGHRDAGFATPHDAAVMTTDSVLSGRDAVPVAGGETGGTVGATVAARDAGSDASARDDDDAGRSAMPKPNGEICTGSSDCASGNCKSSSDGRRCYGLIAIDKACSGAYDCDGYACSPATADGKAGVCVDTSQCVTHDPCSQNYWAATCQLDQLCSAQSSSFNQCYQTACARPRDSNDLCMSELAIAKELIASHCCPPAGAYHSVCDPAPQCGCKDGEKCDVVSAEGQTSCGPTGTVPEGGACSANSDCMFGDVCTMAGCRLYCAGQGDPRCSPHGACKPFAIQQSSTPGAFYCSHTCDPTSPGSASGPFEACDSGQRCEPAADGNSDCLPDVGTGRQGASCDKSGTPDAQACAPGFVCLTRNLICAQYCKVAANDCPVGTCHSNPGTKLFAFDVEIGYCAAP